MLNLNGIVVSTKMKDTVVVAVPFTIRHRKYGKIIKKTTRLTVHNEIADVSVGDQVKLVSSRPYSKNVAFKVVEIISKERKEKREENPAEPQKVKTKAKLKKKK